MTILQFALVVSIVGYCVMVVLMLRLTRRGNLANAVLAVVVVGLGTLSLALRIPVIFFGGS